MSTCEISFVDVDVPRERILKTKPVSRENGNFFSITVLPPMKD